MALPLEGLRKFDPSAVRAPLPHQRAPPPSCQVPPRQQASDVPGARGLPRVRRRHALLPPPLGHRARAHLVHVDGRVAHARGPPPPPPPRTKWTRRVPHPVLIGHAASLSQVPFALSHNFEDSNRYPTAAGQQCWYRMQVETSSTYGGKIAGYLTGGLNFQIEHHLFPRMSSAW